MKQKRQYSNAQITKMFDSSKGKLHKLTGTKSGKKIPPGKLAKSSNKLAQLAYRLNKNK
jgi:hypothetical protein